MQKINQYFGTRNLCYKSAQTCKIQAQNIFIQHYINFAASLQINFSMTDMADPLSQCAKYKILQTECILVHEMREKCFPNVSRGAIKSQMRRMNMLTILAPGELGTKLKQKYGKKQGGYYLTPVEEAHRLLATRATLTSQNDIPHTASHSDPFVPVISHSVTHGTPMQIPIDKPAESNPHYDSLNLDDSLSNLPDQETLIQPSGSKDIPALLPPLPSSPKSSPRTNKTIHESDSSESSIQASQPCLPSLPTQAGDQVNVISFIISVTHL